MPSILADKMLMIPGWVIATGYMIGAMTILFLAVVGALALWYVYQMEKK